MKPNELAKKIKELRTRKGFSQDELAIATQLNLRTIQRIESGETEPRGDTLKRLATSLQVTPDELIDWAEEEDPSMLVFLNLSALSFIALPFLGIIIPLTIWMSKKDKVKNFNTTGKKLLNFQITWCIAFFLIYFLYLFVFITKLKILSHLPSVPGMGKTESLVLLIPIFYLYNITLIIINAIRSYKNKPVFYVPAIPFIR